MDILEVEGQRFEKIGEYRYYYKVFFKLYDAALYTSTGGSAQTVLGATQPFRLQFRYLRTIDKPIILESASKMLQRNLTAEELSAIQDRVDQINNAYTTVNKGDRSALTFTPGQGTTLSINGEDQITIPGDDFARLYFEIWLGEKPISTDLKINLLGQ